MIGNHKDEFMNLDKFFKKPKFLVNFGTKFCFILIVIGVYNTHNQVSDCVIIKGTATKNNTPILIRFIMIWDLGGLTLCHYNLEDKVDFKDEE